MSEEKTALIDKQKARDWFKSPKHMMIYNLFIEGKTINEIAEITKARSIIDVENTVTNKYFMRRLENHVRGVDFSFKVNKVLATENVFNILWNRVKDNIDEISPEVCLRELTKFLPSNKKELIAQIFVQGTDKKEEDNSEDDFIDGDFGYEGLEENKGDKYPELEEHEEGNKRGDPEMDIKEQDTNEQGSTDRV